MARGGAGGFHAHRLFAAHDDELQAYGKKSDDHRIPAAGVAGAATWKGKIGRFRSRRRLFIIAGALFAAWVLLRSMPADFWEPNETGERRMAQFHSGAGDAARSHEYTGAKSGARPPSGGGSRQEAIVDGSRSPPLPKGRRPREDIQYYDGEILFHKLPSTLHSIQRTMGFRKVNQNILFAASNLKSLSTIIPLACAMMSREANLVHVHIAVFGRSDLDMAEIRKINGLDKKGCGAYWHDARPNWPEFSSDFRAEASVASALEHIQEWMHPQAVIMDDSSLEDQWFTRQIRVKSSKFEWPVIELPAGASERLYWLSRLDAQAIRSFHSVSVDIIVQAPQGETGGLLRLLKSLKEADYYGLSVPKLTIELPPVVEPFVSWFVSAYHWPPRTSPLQPVLNNQLNVRHRIPGQTLSAEEASLRFLESFYPANAEYSHVLVLNSNIELSPLFYHWLMYYILQYKHSRIGPNFAQHLIGMSLDIPTTHLNGTTDFEPPTPDPFESSTTWPGRSDPRNPDTRPPFLWQAPNPNAALYFGDKWAEIHDFLKHRVRLIKDGKKDKKKKEKLIGEHFPAWTEYFLEIIRARGWSMVYPATSQRVNSMVTLHRELWKPPEEFAAEFRKATEAKAKVKNDDEALEPPLGNGPLRAQAAHWEQTERVVSITSQPLHAVLPFQGEEPLLRSLPHLLFDGVAVGKSDLGALTDEYAAHFRKRNGGCDKDKHQGNRKIIPGEAGDLFCWGDEADDEWEESELPALGEGSAKGG